MMTEAHELLDIDSPFVGYAYSYPHKSAYRPLSPAVPLAQAWRHERREALSLYLHVPFCEFRCGFCNLFTLAQADAHWTERYLQQLRAEAAAAREALAEASFARVAIGGGTPTYLHERQLCELLEIASGLLGQSTCDVPASCEASPATLTPSKAKLLKEWGVSRISLGVQSFDDAESGRLGRPQRVADVERAIDMVRRESFATLNLDLIYGLDEQSLSAWLATIERAIQHRPEEIYLYPLYIRPLTGLGRTAHAVAGDRLAHYRAARDALQSAGYEQTSLRMFCLPRAGEPTAPEYCCQTDGMVGLGCGARSYTRGLHYSGEFAVGRGGVQAILADYLARPAGEFHEARHGFVLDAEERRRRFVIQSLLQVQGLSLDDYHASFGDDVWSHFPQLSELSARGWAIESDDRLRLTAAGLERSDAIGPWLYSPRVRRLMETFKCD